MANGIFYSVPDFDLRTATHAEFGSYINARRRRYMSKTGLLAEQLPDLAGRRPEELPPWFLAVQPDVLSPRTGWETEFGCWLPKVSFVDGPGFRQQPQLDNSDGTSMRTTLVLHKKDGKKTSVAMTMYNVLSPNTSGGPELVLEEDIALCHVYQLTRNKKKGEKAYVSGLDLAELPQFDLSNIPEFELPNGDIHLDYSDGDILQLETADYELLESHQTGDEGNGMGGCDLPSSGGPRKRLRSEAWRGFAIIAIRGSKDEYAACRHCGSAMKLKGGSSNCGTTSVKRHTETCKYKPGSSKDTL